eukprot:gene17572-27053_t
MNPSNGSPLQASAETEVDWGKVGSPKAGRPPYVVCHNAFMGGWLGIGSVGRGVGSFDVTRVALRGMEAVFKGRRQGWNRQYAAAKKIFGASPACALIRAAIHTEHETLYRRMGVNRTTQGVLNEPADLWRLLKDGRVGSHEVHFTYVFVTNRQNVGEWRFSPTGTGALRDNLSKHAVHADAAREVLYAGEFHINVLDGVKTLVIDNNSGTFAPAADMLPMVEAVLREHIPGLPVRAVHYDDPVAVAAHGACESRKEPEKKPAKKTSAFSLTGLLGSKSSGGGSPATPATPATPLTPNVPHAVVPAGGPPVLVGGAAAQASHTHPTRAASVAPVLVGGAAAQASHTHPTRAASVASAAHSHPKAGSRQGAVVR